MTGGGPPQACSLAVEGGGGRGAQHHESLARDIPSTLAISRVQHNTLQPTYILRPTTSSSCGLRKTVKGSPRHGKSRRRRRTITHNVHTWQLNRTDPKPEIRHALTFPSAEVENSQKMNKKKRTRLVPTDEGPTKDLKVFFPHDARWLRRQSSLLGPAGAGASQKAKSRDEDEHWSCHAKPLAGEAPSAKAAAEGPTGQ